MQRVANLRRLYLVFGFLLFLHCNLAGETFKNPLLVLTGSNPVDVSEGDFNGDGNPDLAYMDGSGLHILLGNGDGTFAHGQNLSLLQGMGGTITVADVNKDGRLDLLLGSSNPQVQIGVWLGKGDGTFGSIIVTTVSLNLNLYATTLSRFGVADLDGDGASDLIVGDSLNNQLYILHGNNSGSFTLGAVIPDGSSPAEVFTGDFNGDGYEDFLVHGWLGADVKVYLGNGDGTFQSGVVYGGGAVLDAAFSSVVLADMDGDGHADMVVGTHANTIEILHGNADGTFATTSSGGATLNSSTTVIGVADFNLDGVEDIAISNGSGLSILLGIGNLSYAPAVPYGFGISAASSALADFNQDGHVDVALATQGGIVLLLAKADGTLQSFDVYDVGQTAASITSTDFNGDHIPDIAVAQLGDGPGILIGKADGTFNLQATSPISGGTGTIVRTGDFNGDGKADLYFTANNSSGVVLFGNGNGTFGPPVDLTGFQQAGFVAAAVADFNNDGRSDLVSLNYESFDVLLGQSNKTFKLLTSTLYGLQSSVAPAIGDFNKDGHVDMITAGVTTIQVLLGEGDGTFTMGRMINTQLPGYNSLCGPTSMATADLDGDGKLDLVVPISCTNVAEIFYGNGDGSFEDPAVLQLEQGYNQVSIADLNGDHLPDLIFSNQALISIVHNAGNRTYSGETHYLAGTVGNIVIQDFNGDGFPDIAVASSGSTVAVLLSEAKGNLTTGTLTIQPEPSTYTKSFSMTLNLAPFKAGSGTPTGTVTFSIDGNPVGTVPLSGATAALTYRSSSLGVGSHTISAAYNGDLNFVPSYFSAQHQVIPILYSTSITLTAHPTPVLAGQTVSFHATVSSAGQVPYGTVSFLDGTTTIGTVTLDDNSIAVFDTALLAPGKHSVKANYLGNMNFAVATSSAVNVVVNVNATTTTLTAKPTTVAVGTPVLLTGAVASSTATPTGSVVFYDGGTLLQNISLDSNGVAVYAVTFSTAGAHVVSATYPANASFAASTSSLSITVTAGAASNATSTSLSAAVSSQVARGFIFTAKVAARSGDPIGNVIILDGSSHLGEVPLDETGTATYQSSSLSPGLHYISAFYSGSSTLAPSVSAVLTESMPEDAPDFSLTSSLSHGVVPEGVSTSAQVDVHSLNGFSEDVVLSCSTGTPRLSCSLQSPDVVGGAGTSRLTIALTAAQGAPSTLIARSVGRFLGVLAAPVWCLAFVRRRRRLGVLLLMTLLSVALVVGCGSPASPVREVPRSVYGVTVTGRSQQSAVAAVIHTVAIPVQVASN